MAGQLLFIDRIPFDAIENLSREQQIRGEPVGGCLAPVGLRLANFVATMTENAMAKLVCEIPVLTEPAVCSRDGDHLVTANRHRIRGRKLRHADNADI